VKSAIDQQTIACNQHEKNALSARINSHAQVVCTCAPSTCRLAMTRLKWLINQQHTNNRNVHPVIASFQELWSHLCSDYILDRFNGGNKHPSQTSCGRFLSEFVAHEKKLSIVISSVAEAQSKLNNCSSSTSPTSELAAMCESPVSSSAQLCIDLHIFEEVNIVRTVQGYHRHHQCHNDSP
jgi:hypothetical protein